MDPQASYNLGGDTVTFNLAEIWPFPMNNGGGASVTSFHHNNAATNDLIASMSMNMNVINRDRDPLVMEQAPNPTPNNSSGGVRRRREEDEAVKGAFTSSNGNATNDCDNKRHKAGVSNENRELKAEGEAKSGKAAEPSGKPAEPPKQDYIHVRARRGQATDSHSLAERVIFR